MVFRGRPSKACKRCRDRRLKCDLRKVSCSSCVRAGVWCTGYRDTDSLRISNQTKDVVKKARSQNALDTMHSPLPPTCHLSIETRARILFFDSYVTGRINAYNFLSPFFNKVSSDFENIALSIDAVSLNFLGRQLNSPSALALSQQKYVAAIRKMNRSLQDQRTILKGTLGSTLLLDIFEKMNPELISLAASGAHIKGAMALLRLKRLETFDNPTGWTVLHRMSMNYIVSCICKRVPVTEEPYMIRAHLAKYVNIADPNWTLMGLMMKYANIMAGVEMGPKLASGNLRSFAELDMDFEKLISEVPPSRTCTRVGVYIQNSHHLDSYYDVYPDRASTWTWNFLRCLRILLYEAGNDEHGMRSEQGQYVAEVLIRDICASVAQSVDCDCRAARGLWNAVSKAHHEHNVEQLLDVRTLIFPLYVAARSWYCSVPIRGWIEMKLEHIADHFAIREAALVRQILGSEDEGARTNPWDIYRLVGSYSFSIFRI